MVKKQSITLVKDQIRIHGFSFFRLSVICKIVLFYCYLLDVSLASALSTISIQCRNITVRNQTVLGLGGGLQSLECFLPDIIHRPVKSSYTKLRAGVVVIAYL